MEPGNKEEGFFLTKRQASAVSAVSILLLLLTFIAGYFWGQKKSAEVFTDKVLNDSFSDQVNYSMYSMYGEQPSEEQSTEEQEEDQSGDEEMTSEPEVKNEQEVVKTPEVVDNSNSNTEGSVKHYAQLVGFGSRRAAEQFANKIQKKGYNLNVYVITKKSKSARGKIITWYQVVTEELNDKEQLMNEVEKIKVGEKLTGIKFNTSN